jgi:hypothetical protein
MTLAEYREIIDTVGGVKPPCYECDEVPTCFKHCKAFKKYAKELKGGDE